MEVGALEVTVEFLLAEALVIALAETEDWEADELGDPERVAETEDAWAKEELVALDVLFADEED